MVGANSYRRKFSSNRGHKMMGGENVQWGVMPWAVAIYEDGVIRKTCSPSHGYSPNAIKQIFTVRYGSNCLTKDSSPECKHSAAMKETGIARVELERFFEVSCTNSDIALLELNDEIDQNANYICLPHRLIQNQLLNLVVFGWGSNPMINAPTMNILQTIPVHQLMPLRLCRRKWPHLPPGQICTAEINTRSVCTGDSGGGLVSENEEGRWVLHGVVSYGSDCGHLIKNGQPRAQVYCSVSYYAASIDRFIKSPFPWIALA
ncbi:unnamed protein product [Toxocara canis]|uniref:Peptidase S1 domain-containing protein n=1 Tax=Toxocara canis TaxID=6265 RepID=A0A3P7GPZ7_TOXCA|nr:unnamed protein product [Toxocara canis]